MRTLINGVYCFVAAFSCPFFSLSSFCQSSATGDMYATASILDFDYQHDTVLSRETDSATTSIYATPSRYDDKGRAGGIKKVYALQLSTSDAYLPVFTLRKHFLNNDVAAQLIGPGITKPAFPTSYAETVAFNFSIPLDFTLYHFNFYLVPGYDLPVNANEILRKARMAAGTTEATAYSDRMNNVFAFTLGIRYLL